MKLSDLKNNESGIILNVRGRGAFKRRIAEMGFVKGKKVTVIKNAPLNDPIEFKLLSYNVSLRRIEASLIDVVDSAVADKKIRNGFGVFSDDSKRIELSEKGKTLNIALVGNPNSGKTTIFNFASNSKERVGNYGGVTISMKTATVRQDGYIFNITDLPGTYSISVFSPEEIYVRDFIVSQSPDVIINVVDASNLERNLYLTTQLIDMNIKVVIALNMFDELTNRKDYFDYKSLGKMIGIPIIPTIGSKGKGIPELLKEVIKLYKNEVPDARPVNINHGFEIEESVGKIRGKIEVLENARLINQVSPRFLALKLLEKEPHISELLIHSSNYKEINAVANAEIERLEKMFGQDCETLITEAKYGFIEGALKETFKARKEEKRNITRTIDNFFTHKYLGFPIFFVFIWVMFFSTFRLGQYPMNWIDSGIMKISAYLQMILPVGSFKNLLIEGIIGGVGGVIIFLPNILILFFFISLMEDTGYMARAAFITDKVMHKIGLHGKSFIPLIMGFGCNVPAVMATRTIENRSNRMLTMLISPFMSCSARLPVYILLLGAFFPQNQVTMLLLIYLTGIFLSVVTALILEKFFLHSKEASFVMELPPYRIPTIRSTIRHMWHKASQYLKKMGGIILLASIIIWGLSHYPEKVEYSTDYEAKIEHVNKQFLERSKTEVVKLSNEPELQKEKMIREIEIMKKAEHQEKSYIGRIGRFIEPVIEPLGFDWKIGICLLTGIAAKEIVVSTMGVIYQADNDDNISEKLVHATYRSGPKAGEKVFNPLVAFCMILFTLIYFPCIAVIVAISNESGSWKWALFSAVYSTALAWFVTFIVFKAGSIFIV